MKYLLTVYKAHLRNRIVQQLQYRLSLALWLIEVISGPTVSIVVWSAVAHTQGGSVEGYTPETFAGYFIVAMLVNYVTHTWVFWGFERAVRNGELSPMLLLPIHPIHIDLAENIAYKILMLIVMVPVIILLTLLFHPILELNWFLSFLFVLALLQAFFLRFFLEWTFALLGFWITRVSVLNQLYFATMLFLSGQLVPLVFFPAPVQKVASILPLRWMVSFPTELCLGHLSLRDILIGLATQSVWIVLSLILLMITWHRGIRHYSAVGA